MQASFLLVVLAHAPLALGAESFSPNAASPTAAVAISSSSSCPVLFGNEEDRDRAGSARDLRVQGIHETRQAVRIVHSVSTWGPVEDTGFSGLTLIDIAGGGDNRLAVVRVEEALASSCAPGTYQVAVDDALGRNARVIAILDEGVLLDRGPSRGIWSLAHHPVRDLDTVWRSGFTLVMAETNSGIQGSSSTPSPRSVGAERSTRPEISDRPNPPAGVDRPDRPARPDGRPDPARPEIGERPDRGRSDLPSTAIDRPSPLRPGTSGPGPRPERLRPTDKR
jgi:hypothetical protein